MNRIVKALSNNYSIVVFRNSLKTGDAMMLSIQKLGNQEVEEHSLP